MIRREAVRLLLLVPVVGLAVAILVVPTRPSFAEAPLDYLFDATTGVVIVAAGLVAWSRRPTHRTGPLLVLAGYLWYVGSLYELVPAGTLIPFLGFALRGYYDPILAFVILSVPGDRLSTARDRAVVGVLVATMAVRSAWRLVAGPGDAPDGPANPFRLVQDAEAFVTVDLVLTLFVGIGLLLVAAAAIVRLSQARPSARRVMVPVLVGGAIWAGVGGAYVIDVFLHEQLGIDIVPWDGPGWTAQYLLRMLGPLGLLLGMLRLRSGSAAAVALLAGAEGPPRGAALEVALRDALGDPHLELLYPSGEGGWLTSSGAPTTLPDGDAARAATILEADGRVCGAVVHDVSLLDDPVVVRTVTAVVRLAIDNERLQDDLRTQLEEVRASRARIVEAADAERRRVERDLHDGAQQRLVALAVSLRTIRSGLDETAHARVIGEVDAASGEVRAAIAELRELTHGLDPSILREAGLGPAMQSLADRSPIPVSVSVEIEGRLASTVETAAYFVASEALTNVAKHSGASQASLRASRVDDRLRLEVSDDGVGGADQGGAGLRGLADRVAAVGGDLSVGGAPGGGTRVIATIPCGS